MADTKRQIQKEKTRIKIMDTAFRLYSAEGFSIPTNQIAKQAGISHGTIFVHFPTSEELQLDVLKRFAQEAGTKLHQISCAGGSIGDLLYAHIHVLETYEAFYKKLIAEISYLPDESRMLLYSLQSIMSQHFTIIMEREQFSGTIKKIPVYMLFNIWIGLLHYYLENSDMFAPNESVLTRCQEELITSYLALISN